MSETLEPSSTCPVVAAGVDLVGNSRGLTLEQIEAILQQMRQITDALAADERAAWLTELDTRIAQTKGSTV